MHAKLVTFVAAVMPALASFAVGCGGAFATASGDDGGPGDDGAFADVVTHDGGLSDAGGQDVVNGSDSSTPWSPVCPATIPTEGSACTQQTVQCEYGTAWWNVACDVVLQCQNTRWTKYQASFEACSPQPGPNPAACPSTYAGVAQGTACSDTGVSCWYPQAECSCQLPLGGPPPPNLDGGPAGYWGCVPEPGCPMPRPRLGTACGVESTYCTYEACAYAQSCTNGVWQSQPMACAQGGGASH
jgi:hypothetical protein